MYYENRGECVLYRRCVVQMQRFLAVYLPTTNVRLVREEKLLKAFENGVLRRIFGGSRRELTGDWRQLCDGKRRGFIKGIIIIIIIIVVVVAAVGRNSAGGTATRYGLDGPMIESRWEVTFSASVQTCPCVHPASYTMGTGSFSGVKRPERGLDYQPHLAPRLKKA